MHKKSQKKVPKLRFPKFNGKWEEKQLGKVLSLVSRPIKMADDKEYSLVTVKRRYEGVVPRGQFKGKHIAVKSQFLLKKNDFLISKRQIVHNACGIVPDTLDGSIVSNEYSVFAPAEGVDIEYFNYFCKQPEVSQSFYLSSIGVHIEKMLFKVDDWFKWKFRFPSEAEQKKIAAFLSAVDRRIEELKKKRDLLKEYKKGLMQQLFNQTLRFANGDKPFPDWEEKKFSKIANRANEKFNPAVEPSRPCVELECLSQETGMLLKTLNSTDLKSLKTTFNEGDILFGKLRPYLKKFLRAQFDGVCSSEIWVLRGTAVSNEFLYYLIQTQKFSDEVNSTTGSKMPRAEWKYIAAIEFEIPCLAEQKKIAECLSALDRKIESVESQVSRTREFKRGLLQKMFV